MGSYRSYFLISLAVAVLSWMTFRFVYSPQENDFLSTTTSHYLKIASERNLQGLVSYTDCIVQDGGVLDHKNGVEKFGVCEFKNDGSTYEYFAALSENAKIVYWNMEAVTK